MSTTDLFVDGYPHGTPQGYDDGCRGGACPTGVAYGLSCKIAKQKSSGDYQYQRLVKSGASIPSIAYALGLVGTESAPAPATPKKKRGPAPTPATAKGGVSLVDAAAAVAKVAAAGAGSIAAIAASAPTDEPETFLPATGSDQAKDVWEQTAEILGTQTTATAPAAAPAPKTGEIRAWAIAKGYKVGAKGTLPKHVVDHYWESTGRLNPTAVTTEPDTNDAPAVTPAPETVTVDTKPATPDTESVEPDTDDVDEVTVEITIDVPDAIAESKATRPDWADVSAHADVEAARNLAVRLEQELARSEEQRATDRQHHADSLRRIREESAHRAAELEVLSDRLSRRTAERVAAEERADTAESALELTIAKWGEERAATESSYALILDQARTINILTDEIAQRPRLIDDRRYAHGTEAIIAVDEPIIAAGPTTATIEEVLTGQAPPATFLATAPRRPWHRR